MKQLIIKLPMAVAAALLMTIGGNSVALFGQSTPPPTTASGFQMYENSGNTVTIRSNPANSGNGTFLWPQPSSGIFTSDATGTMSLQSFDALLSGATLTQNALWVGNASNNPSELLSPGIPGTGSILTIDGSGAPQWQANPGGILPVGSSNATLRWDGGTNSWVSNTGLTSDGTNTTITGDLTVNGTNVNLPSGSIDNNELANSSINVSYGTGITGDASVALGGTLNLNNSGVTSLSGTTNQVNVSAATGAVTLSTPQDIHSDAIPTFDGLTLDNLSSGSASNDVVVSNGGSLETRTFSSLGGADGSEPFITFGPDAGSLTDNRILTGGTAISLSNSGSDNGTLTINNTGVTSATAGTGISVSSSTGPVTISNTGVTSLSGTVNQVNVSASTGSVTLSTPQDIHSDAIPTFDGLTLDNLSSGSASNDVVVSNGGSLETRSFSSLGGANGSEPFITFGPGGSSLTDNRVLNAGTGVSLTNSGVDNGNLTVAIGQDVATTAAPTFTGMSLTALSQDNTLNDLVVEGAGGQLYTRQLSTIINDMNLTQNSIWVGDAFNDPSELASSGTQGDILTINGSGAPSWSTPVGTVQALGSVTGTGTWQYTVNTGSVNPVGRVIMVTLQSSSGLQVTHVVNNVTPTGFDVEFPVNIGGTETFHWVVY